MRPENYIYQLMSGHVIVEAVADFPSAELSMAMQCLCDQGYRIIKVQPSWKPGESVYIKAEFVGHD